MSGTFDINNRETWDWDYEAVGDVSDETSGYRLNAADTGSFYQVADGVPYFQPCPSGLVFNPLLNVCDWPHAVDEAQVYDWVVSKGFVNDQR
ncbi:MAG: chitin binding peritrophin-A domain-containing protein [Pseudonocardiaceae bacterium]